MIGEHMRLWSKISPQTRRESLLEASRSAGKKIILEAECMK
jgi:hypothetical protein